MAEDDETNAWVESARQHANLGPGFGLRSDGRGLEIDQQSHGKDQAPKHDGLRDAYFVSEMADGAPAQ